MVAQSVGFHKPVEGVFPPAEPGYTLSVAFT